MDVRLTTGRKIGDFTDRATCSTVAPPPCLVFGRVPVEGISRLVFDPS